MPLALREVELTVSEKDSTRSPELRFSAEPTSNGGVMSLLKTEAPIASSGSIPPARLPLTSATNPTSAER